MMELKPIGGEEIAQGAALPYSEKTRDQVLCCNDCLHTSTAWGR